MSKISPTDKLFDELIPDSPEYWQAIENIDFEPKPKPSWQMFFHWVMSCFICESDTVDTASNAKTFSLTPLRDVATYLSELYPDNKFLVYHSEELIAVSDKTTNYNTHISLREYAYWDEQDYRNFLSKVRYAVSSIEAQKEKLRNDVRMRCFADDIEAGRRRL